MSATWTLPAGNVKVEPAKEAFTHALIGVTIIMLVKPDDIAKIGDDMLRRSAQSVYDEAVAEATAKQWPGKARPMRTSVTHYEIDPPELKPPVEEHRINYGRLFPGKTFKADCTCGWSFEGDKEQMNAARRAHEELI